MKTTWRVDPETRVLWIGDRPYEQALATLTDLKHAEEVMELWDQTFDGGYGDDGQQTRWDEDRAIENGWIE